ncbi:phage integrase N-terminal SAM-like domain-containing protein [Paenibacillus pini]|uniref:Integrase SAM-like N-terminal domain-containing protein n=1 Tax=Paenibacillus pini JCM 16418 TaxID=1236976 RepID=W7YDL0_9BACL|nr:phage integrase N-terminal SAM-like domain-containing protein [Paenibacillus pini]GAF06547.1 hypothetical protein JCM16418_507 [Paenibacillus pini JCM 16418]
MLRLSLMKRDESSFGLRLLTYHKEGVDRIKQIPGRVWLEKERVWSISYDEKSLVYVFAVFQHDEVEIESGLYEDCQRLKSLVNERDAAAKVEEAVTNHAENIQQHALMRKREFDPSKLREQLRIRGYSAKTIKAYIGHVKRFYQYLNQQHSDFYSSSIQSYSLLLLDQNFSHAYVNQALTEITDIG